MWRRLLALIFVEGARYGETSLLLRLWLRPLRESLQEFERERAGDR